MMSSASDARAAADTSLQAGDSGPDPRLRAEKQVTFAPHGHILTNVNVWSPDSQWIVYDVRSDPAGESFDGSRIERANVETGEVQVLYESSQGAHCGVVTCSPVDDRIVFIHGPENPTDEWQYAAHHRRGAIVRSSEPGMAVTPDARDLAPPFTPGALRGGTHVHVFSADGEWVSFTYEDHVLSELEGSATDHDVNQRNVGVSVPVWSVDVDREHPRNHDGSHFSVLVTKTTNQPAPGSDEVSRAFSDAWVGADGYLKPDGTRQRRAIAFQGHVVTRDGQAISEAFIADIPEDVTVAGDGPLEGTATHRPLPPKGTVQRRLTHTADRKHPGLQGPRHWLRSSPDGSQIAFLLRDDGGTVQLWTVSPNGEPRQLTRNEHDIASAFTWSPDGRYIAHVMDNSVCVTRTADGKTFRLTARSDDAGAPRPEACVFSPDGAKIAYVRRVKGEDGGDHNQVFVAVPATDE